MSEMTAAELDIAARVLELARRAAGPAAEIDVAVTRDALELTRFANSYIHQNVAGTTTGVKLRVHAAGRTASAATTLVGAGDLAALAERAVAAARLSPLDPGWPGLAPVAAVPESTGIDPAIVNVSPEDRALKVKAFVEAAGGLTTAGYVRTRHVTVAFANSAGQAAAGTSTEAALDGIAKTATSDGVSRQAARYLADLDGAVHGARAAAKALASQDPVELAPGDYEVVLEPEAVSDLLLCLSMYGFNGKSVNEGTSFLKIGERQLDPSVTIVDDPLSGPAAGLPFDIEGTPRTVRTLVENGVSRSATHDLRSAREAGVASTGGAMAGAMPWGPTPLNTKLVPSASDAAVTEVEGPAADSAVLALVAGMRRGLLVSDHWYTRCLDPRRLVMTGLTRNGVWLVEDGEIVAPVRNMRFTQSYPEALGAGRVLGIGSHAPAHALSWTDGAPQAVMSPALRLSGWAFTGGASG